VAAGAPLRAEVARLLLRKLIGPLELVDESQNPANDPAFMEAAGSGEARVAGEFT
jgi:hypothetical protein